MSIENYGNYQLLKKLAMGGMAQIYLARQRGPEGFEKRLVVKRILPHLAENEDFVRMFLDEARIAARLNHPNIVQIYDLGAQDDSFFIAMEYIHGEDLRRVWKRADRADTPIPVPLVCRVIIEACAGLDYAHKKTDAAGKPLNIVHRDISPQNILLTFDGRVKVVDFGIAKAADQATVTRSGVLKGKYSYMSPEQAAGQKLDRRSDIFALGVVLYELLTCNRLFKRPSDMATLQAVAECAIPPPSQVNPRVPEDLDPIVMKALARSPEDRYSEAVQLQLALEDWLVANQHASSSAHVADFMGNLYAARLAEEARLGDVLVEDSESASAPEAKPSSRSAETMAAPRQVDSGVAPAARDSTDRLERTPPSPPSRTPPRVSRSEARGGGGTSERKAVEPRRTVEPRRAAELGEEPRSAERPMPRPSRARQPALPAAPVPAPTAPAPQKQSNRLVVGVVAGGLLVGLLLVGAWWALRPTPSPGPSDATARPVTQPKPASREEPKPTVVVSAPSTPRTEPAQAPTVGAPPTVVASGGGSSTGQESTGEARSARQTVVSSATVTAPPKEERKPEPARAVVAEVRETRPQESRKAMVRFVVKPITVWAEVSCNGTKMGETPFRDVQMTVGTYDCKFSNPDQGTRTRRVEVKPNVPNIVVVQF